jgi:hypothetical protein
MNNLHQVANRQLSSTPHFSQQKTPAFAVLVFLLPLAMIFSVAAAERFLLAARHLFSV